jgi:hypothetical protein
MDFCSSGKKTAVDLCKTAMYFGKKAAVDACKKNEGAQHKQVNISGTKKKSQLVFTTNLKNMLISKTSPTNA